MATVLLVDDSPVVRELLKVYFILNGVQLFEASDGLDALVQVKVRRPDIVVADLRMPRLDGVGLCEALRADAETRSVPVIIITGDRDPLAAKRCLDAGAREVFAKPIQPQPLLAAVRRNLETA